MQTRASVENFLEGWEEVEKPRPKNSTNKSPSTFRGAMYGMKIPSPPVVVHRQIVPKRIHK